MSMLENLEFIKLSGVDAFLARGRGMRSCKCGGLVSCHSWLCFACSLDELKKREKRNINRWM